MSLNAFNNSFRPSAVPYLEVAWKTAPNAAGQSVSANTLTVLTLDSIIQNTASAVGEAFNGVTVASNKVQGVPSGAYYFEAEIALSTPNTCSAIFGLRNATDVSILKAGKTLFNADYSVPKRISGQFELSAAKDLELVLMTGTAKTVGVETTGNITDSTAGLDQRTTLQLWKIA